MKRKILAFIAIIMIALLALSACGSSNLVGQWQGTNNSLTWEFFQDGTALRDGSVPHTWSTSGDRVTIHYTGSGSPALAGLFEFQISGDTLTMVSVGQGGATPAGAVHTFSRQ